MAQIKFRNAEIRYYSVDFDNAEIVISLRKANEEIEFLFAGVLTHHFEAIGRRNVLYDLERVNGAELYELHEVIFSRMKVYKFPFRYRNKKEFVGVIRREKVGCYRIIPVQGMAGFVLAKTLKVLRANHSMPRASRHR